MSAIIETEALRALGFLHYPPLAVQEGKLNFLIGESGSGKSTLLRLLNGTQSPEAGVIRLQGVDTREIDSLALRRTLLLAAQTPYLFAGSISDNFNSYYDVLERKLLTRAEMAESLALCCAPFSLDACCDTLSGGERQRVFLAICLSLSPKVLMLDEPTSALDDETAQRFFENLKQIAREQGMTLLVICHNTHIIERFAEHVIALSRELHP